MTEERRVRNDRTGGEKGQKLARYDLIPVYPLTALAEHYGRGAEKYFDRNWELGVNWSLPYAALMRHVTAWWNGEETDPETGTSHLSAVAWHAFALLEYTKTHPELDDRPRATEGPLLVEEMAGTFGLAESTPAHGCNPCLTCGICALDFWAESDDDQVCPRCGRRTMFADPSGRCEPAYGSGPLVHGK
jgi:rubredoxin